MAKVMQSVVARTRCFVPALVLIVLSAGMYLFIKVMNVQTDSMNVSCRQDQVVSVSTEDVLIPEDSILLKSSIDELLRLYERYTNSRQILCRRIQRTGGIYDGGKDVCVDKFTTPQKPCLVYSFGSNNNFNFEREVISLYGCEVLSFDPSMGDAKIKNPPGCSFYPLGISDKNEVNEKGWNVKTLSSIMNTFNHKDRTIDILKIDVEGSEWNVITEMITSGSAMNARQLLVEFHFYYPKDVVASAKEFAVFRELYRAGFRIFSTERNTECKCHATLEGRQVARLIEIAFINTRFITISQ